MPGWLTDHFSCCLSDTLVLNLKHQSAQKSKTKNGRLASLASNVHSLELWAIMG